MPQEISPNEASHWLEHTRGALLVDVRDPDEWRICHLHGAALLPMRELASRAPSELTDRSAPILLYCHHGVRSLRAAAILESLGYTNTRSLAGGIERWSLEIDPAIPRY